MSASHVRDIAPDEVRLSDIIRAAEDTRLGRFGICAAGAREGEFDIFFDCDGFFGGCPHPGPDEHPDVVVAINGTEALVYVARDEGGLHAHCLSPQRLVAVLDALADERYRIPEEYDGDDFDEPASAAGPTGPASPGGSS